MPPLWRALTQLVWSGSSAWLPWLPPGDNPRMHNEIWCGCSPSRARVGSRSCTVRRRPCVQLSGLPGHCVAGPIGGLCVRPGRPAAGPAAGGGRRAAVWRRVGGRAVRRAGTRKSSGRGVGGACGRPAGGRAAGGGRPAERAAQVGPEKLGAYGGRALLLASARVARRHGSRGRGGSLRQSTPELRSPCRTPGRVVQPRGCHRGPDLGRSSRPEASRKKCLPEVGWDVGCCRRQGMPLFAVGRGRCARSSSHARGPSLFPQGPIGRASGTGGFQTAAARPCQACGATVPLSARGTASTCS